MRDLRKMLSFRQSDQSAIEVGSIGGEECPSCTSRKHLINQLPQRGVLLNAFDITVNVLCVDNVRSKATIDSIREQLLRPALINICQNNSDSKLDQLRLRSLEDVTTPYVATVVNGAVLNDRHLFDLANHLVRTGTELVYSCIDSCNGDGCKCRETYLGITSVAKTKKFSRISRLEHSTWGMP